MEEPRVTEHVNLASITLAKPAKVKRTAPQACHALRGPITHSDAAWNPGGKPPEKKQSKNIFPRMCLVFGAAGLTPPARITSATGTECTDSRCTAESRSKPCLLISDAYRTCRTGRGDFLRPWHKR